MVPPPARPKGARPRNFRFSRGFLLKLFASLEIPRESALLSYGLPTILQGLWVRRKRRRRRRRRRKKKKKLPR